MPAKSFYDICSRPQTQKKIVKDLCLDFSDENNPKYFIQSEISMIDFDALAKEVGSTFRSPDALELNDGILHFIEFKNQDLSDVDIKNCQKKFYDGLSIFGILSQNNGVINDIQIQYTIVCNPEKNMINTKRSCKENPVFGTMQNNIKKSEGSLISDKEIANYQRKKDGKLQNTKKLLLGLAKFGINVEIDALLIQEEIDEFLSQFQNSALT